MFLEINLKQKTLKLYTPWVYWKNQCRLTIRKHVLLWNNVIILLTYLLKTSFTHFMTLVSFYTSWNMSENQMFSDVFRVYQALSRDFQHVCSKMHMQILLAVRWCVMSSFLFLKFYNFIKGIMHINSIFKKPKTNVFIFHQAFIQADLLISVFEQRLSFWIL